MTGIAALGSVVAALVLVGIVVVLARSVRDEGRERDWPAGSATVIEARPWVHSDAPAPSGSYVLRARLVTKDGRAVDGWAEGAYTRADQWVGTTRPAWHHPGDPQRFRLSEPRGALRGVVQLLPVLLLLLVVLVLFVGISALTLARP